MNLQWKQITLYYWLHNDIAIYRFTIIHFITFLFLFFVQQHMFFLALKTHWINEPTWPAKLTRQADPPKCLAMETRQIHTRTWPAKFTSQRSPLPRSRSPGRTQLASLPPPSPHGSVSGAGGGGGEPARPAHASWAGTFAFPWMFTYSYRTWHIRILYRADK